MGFGKGALAALILLAAGASSPAQSLLVSSQFFDVLQVDPSSGAVSTFKSGLPGDPEDMAFTASGDILQAISGSGGKVLRIDPVTGATIQSYSIGFNALAGIDVVGDTAYLSAPSVGDILTLNLLNGTVSQISSGLNFPYGLQFSASGELYVTELGSDEISRVDISTGMFTPIAQGLSDPTDLVFDANGNMYIAQNASGIITRISPGADLMFGTLDDVRADVATNVSDVSGLEIVANKLYFTRAGTTKTVSALDLQSLQISPVANLPEVGGWIGFDPVAINPVPEPSSLTLAIGGLGFLWIMRNRKRARIKI